MSKIEWTEKTWNPVVGCEVESPGCKNCYAMKMAHRIQKMQPDSHYQGTTKTVNNKHVWTGVIKAASDDVLKQPLKRRKATMYFVNSMGDLFHPNVTNDMIDKVFAIMALASHHTFQILTKHPQRMSEYLDGYAAWVRVEYLIHTLKPSNLWNGNIVTAQSYLCSARPLPNVWLGISAENHEHLKARIEYLLRSQAAKRFISFEPALGYLSASNIDVGGDMFWGKLDALTGKIKGHYMEGGHEWDAEGKIDWVIAGGESGSNARPASPHWFRQIRDDCKSAGVPFFFKQWGEFVECDPNHNNALEIGGCVVGDSIIEEPGYVRRVGKKSAGRSLDGSEHNELPCRAYG